MSLLTALPLLTVISNWFLRIRMWKGIPLSSRIRDTSFAQAPCLIEIENRGEMCSECLCWIEMLSVRQPSPSISPANQASFVPNVVLPGLRI